jgi:squalene-hopene/tetraprenyl-beta-curcumene cyclase
MLRYVRNMIFRKSDRESAPVLPEFQQNEDSYAFLNRDTVLDQVSASLRKTQSYYFDQQHPDGYWWYELESNVTITAEYLMLLHFLDLRDEETDRKIINNILRHQRSDGTWALYWGGPGDISTTVEAYFALKLAGVSVDSEPLKKAKEFILRAGGVEATRVFTKVFLSLFGQFDWKALPSLPVEINLLPSWFPINIYTCSSWARSTIVPLSMVLAFKPVKEVPESAFIREIYKDPVWVPESAPEKLAPFSWKKVPFVFDSILKTWDNLPAQNASGIYTICLSVDGILKIWENLPVRPFMKRAMKKTEQWILEHQDASGDWGGIQPAMVNSLLALATLGYETSSEPMKKGLEALKRFTIETEDELTLQSCISPVWDTALVGEGLLFSGMEREHPSVVKACAWLASKQIFQKGDWSIKKPRLEPGGWAFEFDNSWYPDVDDTAIVLLFLNKLADTEYVKPENLEKGVNWILGMQGKDGGWGAFDVDNNFSLLNKIPFGDLEAMIDPSTADLTGRVLELLGTLRFKRTDPRVKRAIAFIKKTQEENGSWWGRWGVNYLYGTSTVLAGLRAIGEDMSSPYIRKTVAWLKSSQNLDGGWGESCASYGACLPQGCVTSTSSQTAWAIMSLISAGEVGSHEVLKGVAYLLRHQKQDGTWDEEAFTGTGFPKHFFIRYHNYRNCFPLIALGKYHFQSMFSGIKQ